MKIITESQLHTFQWKKLHENIIYTFYNYLHNSVFITLLRCRKTFSNYTLNLIFGIKNFSNHTAHQIQFCIFLRNKTKYRCVLYSYYKFFVRYTKKRCKFEFVYIVRVKLFFGVIHTQKWVWVCRKWLEIS